MSATLYPWMGRKIECHKMKSYCKCCSFLSPPICVTQVFSFIWLKALFQLFQFYSVLSHFKFIVFPNLNLCHPINFLILL
jgi:hypothetical protein